MGTLSIAKREFRSYFNSPLAYGLICICLFLLGLVFFNYNGGFWQANRASFTQLFVQLPRGLSWVIIPVITMGLLAEEKRSGTLEMLITLPVRDYEVILGKFLGAWGLVMVVILSTLIYPLAMFTAPWDLGSLDSGPIFSSYVGLSVYSAAAVSIGLFISAMTERQFIALLATVCTLFILHALGGGIALGILPQKAELVVAFISFDSRLTGFMRGMINSRDVIYFLTITVGCLFASFWALERRKWA